MSRGCCGQGCNCSFSDGDGLAVLSGSGTQGDPLQVFVPFITPGIGDGGVSLTTFLDDEGIYTVDAYINEDSRLDMLGNVNAPSPATGQVLGFNGTNWHPQAPTTAPVGAVQHDASMSGDGSAGTPLLSRYAAERFVGLGPLGGIGLTDDGVNQLVRHFADEVSRDAMDIAPDVNTIVMLDSEPGKPQVFDGTGFNPLMLLAATVGGPELLPLSGGFTPGIPISVLTKQISATTDSDGLFSLLDAAELTGYSGVLGVWFTPANFTADPYLVAVQTDDDAGEVNGVGWAIDGTGTLVSSAVAGSLLAILY